VRALIPDLLLPGILLPLVLTCDPAQSLTLQQVLKRMEEQDQLRSGSLARYTCFRRYLLENQRFHTTAEISVRMTYSYPGRKEFEVISERGPSIIRQRVLRRMIEAEAEANGDDVREHTRITPLNYDFQLVGVDILQGRRSYVLEVTPKASNKFSIRGRIWVDSEDFAIVRVKAAPAKSPSVWIRNTQVVQQYERLGPVWLPLFNHSETDSLAFGRTDVTIDSWDYEITPLNHMSPSLLVPTLTSVPQQGQAANLDPKKGESRHEGRQR
jgi:hypothetical protein